LENSKIQNILTNSPEINIKHTHKNWIKTMVLMEMDYIITGSADCSIKCIYLHQDFDSEYENNKKEEYIRFNIEKAHEREIKYIMKVNNNEIISCGGDGVIKRWRVDCSNHNYKLIEIFTFKNSQKVHKSANKIIMLTNGNLCSCGNDHTIKFWMRNNTYKRYECYQILKCEAKYVQSILELENNKLVAGGWGHTQFFDIKKYQAETDIENTKTGEPNSMIRMGENIICTDDKIYFIDIKSQQLIKTIQIEYEYEEGIYCLYPFKDNLFICGGNSKTIDIYDAKIYEKVASRPVKDEFIFDIKNDEEYFIFCGSKNIFAYVFKDFRHKADNKAKIKREKSLVSSSE
jgi:WD40 repeat protein